ncbi:T9SS type A sorting domain-containing protein [Pontibacter litorisediminis]|uniref:T9SS type A sorting domain-containing protein n=1 Tax=Pontibacter litorisediminis TaxID=1846260 RepID=UPI0023ED4AA9|nr:T9SS type A sorting domain-containing protein [Pontibacter litorisediminis]
MKTKLLLSCLAFLLLPMFAQAIHVMSGHISYTVDEQNPLKYNFTLKLYTSAWSQAHDVTVNMHMGDGNIVEVPWASYVHYSRNYHTPTFHWSYTFGQEGDYTVAWIGPGRSSHIVNLPEQSDSTRTYIYTEVRARALMSNRHSVNLAGMPVFEAYVGEAMTQNFLAYDADGDKLFYSLVPPKTSTSTGGVVAVPDYQHPEGLTINEYGELRWDNPTIIGRYETSVHITEQRNGIVVGSTVVDITLHVGDRAGQPQLTLLNKDRLEVREDGSIQTWPNQPLKFEYYLQRSAETEQPLFARYFSEIDTLNLTEATLTVRDTVNGFALTLAFTPTPAMERASPYLIGVRGRGTDYQNPDLWPQPNWGYYLEDDWDFVYLYVGEQQPTASEDELKKAGFILYPNPIADKFVIEAPDMPGMFVHLFDANGKRAGALRLQPGKNQFSRPASLSRGLYFYTIYSHQKPVGSGKVVVR